MRCRILELRAPNPHPKNKDLSGCEYFRVFLRKLCVYKCRYTHEYRCIYIHIHILNIYIYICIGFRVTRESGNMLQGLGFRD